MYEPPLLTLQNVDLSFGDRTLFEDLTLMLYRGQRVCLVGRNGSGKSTLMKLLSGTFELDKGTRFLQPGLRVGFLTQDYIASAGLTVKDHVIADGTVDNPVEPYEAEAILDQLKISPDRLLTHLSGGERRRADLARVLASTPEILLLDEPTNHLDIGIIEWLEDNLKSYRGALLMISHDRRFLTNVTTQTVWLENKRLYSLNKGYAHFEAWSEEVQEQEEKALARLGKKLAQETEWLHRGVTARRRRNQGRLRRLMALREEKQATSPGRGRVVMPPPTPESESKLVIEALHVKKAFLTPTQNVVIAKDFSLRLLRGDRVGIIGNNGAGKTTLLKLLLGMLPPDEGTLRRASNLSVVYCDQTRVPLKPNFTLWETLCEHGGDRVTVQGQSRHVVAYLKDFLFSEKQILNPVATLSGGERNRLMLAKALTQPADLLVLDEPTNDLDMDTLDILEEILGDFEGTLLLVSHDRDFLDRLVTSTIVVEGHGKIEEYVGGYTDVLRYQAPVAIPVKKVIKEKASAPQERKDMGSSRRLSYKFEREQEALQMHLPLLREKVQNYETLLMDVALYEKQPEKFHSTIAALEQAKRELEQAEERWLEIELMREGEDGESS